jgi:2-dehydro-3-deoxy-D-arabinonate dehydratase
MRKPGRVLRFRRPDNAVGIGLMRADGTIVDLTARGTERFSPLFEDRAPAAVMRELLNLDLPQIEPQTLELLPPLEQQEVWAAGVTYFRSKAARMDESHLGADLYDRVYDAERPEIFFKSLPEKVVGPGQAVGIRKDALWSVPEPELALVLNSAGKVFGYTIANDLSSRDIEGENPLYLPQAKIYSRSCAIGPWIVVGPNESEARTWTIGCKIHRAGALIFEDQTDISRIKRSFSELAGYLFRCQSFPHGAVLLTGTGIVPPDDFTLQAGDRIEVSISGIGILENRVVPV